jgi:hypothetical protein
LALTEHAVAVTKITLEHAIIKARVQPPSTCFSKWQAV